MDRRNLLTGMAASAWLGGSGLGAAAVEGNTLLEVKTWYLRNSAEEQTKRVSQFLEHGLTPAVERAGARLEAAFATLIAPGGPFYVTVTQYASFAAMGEVLMKLREDGQYATAAKALASGVGAPFARVESSLLRSFNVMPRMAAEQSSAVEGPGRVFELRTYEAPSLTALTKKVGMFDNGEAKIFERLGMRPVFFGETLVGPRQPNLMYMLSYENLGTRDKLWQSFVGDPEWKKLSAIPELKDAEIVSNISNVILRGLPFSRIR